MAAAGAASPDGATGVIRYECDRCAAPLAANDAGRFIVRLEVFAAAGPVDLRDAGSGDANAGIKEVLRELAAADPDNVEDQTYRILRFDVCDACRKALLRNPLG